MLSFNSVLPSLGVYTTPAYYRMIFDGFLTLKSCTYICTYVCVCVSVCGGEFTYPGNTRDWLWLGCEVQQTARHPAQTEQPSRAVKPPGCKRPSGAQETSGWPGSIWKLVCCFKPWKQKEKPVKITSRFLWLFSQQHAQLAVRAQAWKVKRTLWGDTRLHRQGDILEVRVGLRLLLSVLDEEHAGAAWW